MQVPLRIVGETMLADRWLCPSVSRDDLGAGGEALYQLAELLRRTPTQLEIAKRPTLRKCAEALKAATPSLPPSERSIMLRGVSELDDVGKRNPRRRITLVAL